MWHIMGSGFGLFFGLLWMLVVLGVFVSWFFLVYAGWRAMKANEKILEVLADMTQAIKAAHNLAPVQDSPEPENQEQTQEEISE